MIASTTNYYYREQQPIDPQPASCDDDAAISNKQTNKLMIQDNKNETGSIMSSSLFVPTSTTATMLHNMGPLEAPPPMVPASDCSEVSTTLHSPNSSCTSFVSRNSYYEGNGELDDMRNGDNDMLDQEGPSMDSSFVECLMNSEDQEDTQEKERSVHWGSITIREYPIIPGIHPDTLCGPPLTIDWDYVSEWTTRVDQYERERTPRKDELRLAWPVRRRMLQSVGATDEELRNAQQQAAKGRRQRDRTLATLRFRSRCHELFEEKLLFRKIGRSWNPNKPRPLRTTTRY